MTLGKHQLGFSSLPILPLPEEQPELPRSPRSWNSRFPESQTLELAPLR